jgi:CPA2 family monovalent cation:H+ antiporter-2
VWAEFDLRGPTGATILAILRGQRTEALPTGRDRLEAEDVLVLAGPSEATERAREMIQLGPRAPAALTV